MSGKQTGEGRTLQFHSIGHRNAEARHGPRSKGTINVKISAASGIRAAAQ
jgi:hypothetical protein